MKPDIRRILTFVEETRIEQGRPVEPVLRRAVSASVIRNPYAGRYVEDLSPLYEAAAELGGMLIDRAVSALGISGDTVESFGKAALVGEDGELEHAAAFLHPKLGAPIRATLGGGASLIPSSKKRGAPGASFDVPLGYKDAAYVRSHFDGIEVRLGGAPRADEIVVAVAVTSSGRPLARVGGLARADAKGLDGLR